MSTIRSSQRDGRHHAGHRRQGRPLRRQVSGECRECGCTVQEACWHDGIGPCYWATPQRDLCSHCAAIAAGELQRSEVEQPSDRKEFHDV